MKNHKSWPVLTRYDSEHLNCIAMPIGGVGTGSIYIGGRGDLRHWEIVNRPNKEFHLRYTFFSLYAKAQGHQAVSKVLEGRLTPPYGGPFGSQDKNAGMPRFKDCEFLVAYPLGQVLLSDPDVPLDVKVMAFNPLIPGDADNSGIPVAIIRFVLRNDLDVPVEASVCGSMTNFIGTDGINGEPNKNRNNFVKKTNKNSVCGINMTSEGVDPLSEQYGTLALATTSSQGVSYRQDWKNCGWADSILDFWDDFSEDGKLYDPAQEQNRKRGSLGDVPQGSLAVSVEVPAKGQKEINFLIGWHFPNRLGWNPPANKDELDFTDGGRCKKDNVTVGNYYTTKFKNAWDVVEQVSKRLPELERETVKFVDAFCSSSLPQEVKEAALNNLSTLSSQTCFRTADGRFFGWEGCGQTYGWGAWQWGKKPRDYDGSCYGSCTHVWNYEQATAFLFGKLACTMRDVEFNYCTDDKGLMSFRVHLPIESKGTELSKAAADGQMGCLMKLYRDWQLSGDDEMLKKLWPKARKAMEFCWVEKGWDANQDGVMEGPQHNTMDVEYYGPNPQMAGWYLGALRACAEMASYLGQSQFSDKCQKLFEKGKKWVDENLFNGEYYEQEIMPAESIEDILPELLGGITVDNITEPDFQLGNGCLVDQLVGQYMAHICGLGYVLDADQVKKTLKSIMKYNFMENFSNHFNHMRSYVLNDESGLLMARFPKRNRLKRPFPYFNEVMTGFEYTAAVGMLYEGLTAEGLKCFKAVRERFDGVKRNPFDEAECGHHYARAMASWAGVLAMTGFHYSAITGVMEFNAAEGVDFWSTGYAWGTLQKKKQGEKMAVEFKVLHGNIRLSNINIKEYFPWNVRVSEEKVEAPISFKTLLEQP